MSTPVMIVDDNDMLRESVEIFFRLKGRELVSVSGGAECIRRLEGGFRGIILLDVMMPGLDGWDTIREMVSRGVYDGCFIIMLTALVEPGAKMEGLQGYVTDYLTKPFAPDELLEMVSYYGGMLAADKVFHG